MKLGECVPGKRQGVKAQELKQREKKYHGILLRDTLVLSCLLIKALICLAEGKEAGMCADIISKLKAMPSGSRASTQLYLKELLILFYVILCIYFLTRKMKSAHTPLTGSIRA